MTWAIALTTMGIACTVNAVRCGRVHCYVTGPFFLLMALGTMLYGVGLLPLGHNGWRYLGMTILVGGVALCCLSEMLLGTYRRT